MKYYIYTGIHLFKFFKDYYTCIVYYYRKQILIFQKKKIKTMLSEDSHFLIVMVHCQNQNRPKKTVEWIITSNLRLHIVYRDDPRIFMANFCNAPPPKCLRTRHTTGRTNMGIYIYLYSSYIRLYLNTIIQA